MYTREQIVTLALKYKGASKGSARHKDLVNTFNKVKPNGEVANYKCAWCAITVTALAIKAGFTIKNFPMSYNCGTMITKAKALGVWKETDSYKPKIGDVIIYSWTDTKPSTELKKGASHTGIVVSVSGNNFEVLEGNKGTSSACGIRKMKVNGQYIRGFIVPKYTAGKPITKPTGKYTGAIPKPTLKNGSKGTETKNLQKFLNWYHAEWKLDVDGSFGSKTENALKKWQSAEGLTADGIYGSASYKKALTYRADAEKTPNEKCIDDGMSWAKKIVADGSYHYKKYGSNTLSKQCPICHNIPKGTYHGWNCIGFQSAILYHGMGISSIHCACNGTGNDGRFDKMLANPSKAISIWEERNGSKGQWQLVYNKGKAIPESMLKKGDVLIHAYSTNLKKYKHSSVKADIGYLWQSSGGTAPVSKNKYPISGIPCVMAIRYTGKGRY